VIPNAALVAPFGIKHNIGLDELKFIGKPEAIFKLIEIARGTKPGEWADGKLQSVLKELNLDIWFSIEGTDFNRERPILDGDILAASGTIIATNRDLLAPGAPAGLPVDGVDFGLDAFATAREALGRANDFRDLFFSTEILHHGKAPFTDGDVLPGRHRRHQRHAGQGVSPAADFLGLDALWFLRPAPGDRAIPR
jgi:hypothetical protein